MKVGEGYATGQPWCPALLVELLHASQLHQHIRGSAQQDQGRSCCSCPPGSFTHITSSAVHVFVGTCAGMALPVASQRLCLRLGFALIHIIGFCCGHCRWL